MPFRTFGLKQTLSFAIAILCLHAATTWLTLSMSPAAAMTGTYFFLTLCPLYAYAACCWYAWNCSAQVRLNWVLLCFGLFLWTTGMALSAWGDIVQHASRNIAFISDFVFFIYGVPILLAISLPAEDQRSWLFSSIDALQTILAACLFYVEVFSVIPFASQESSPVPLSLLLRTYNIENLVLAGAATLRLISCAEHSEERVFFRILSTYLWLYAALVAVYNYLDSRALDATGFRNIIEVVPSLFLATIVIYSMNRRSDRPHRASRRTQLSLFIENGSPIFFTFALLALGAAITHRHFRFGIAAIVIALVLYGLRATLLQSRYVQSEHALQEARDRLEALSMQDALTGIANRRRFDQILEIEWNRATRVRQPLSLLMIDVDFFKNLNDRYGHRAGDECLVQIARTLLGCLPRSGDLIARYGGEEFAVILPATNRAGAEMVAERMQIAVRALNIPNERDTPGCVTVSTGIATYEVPLRGSILDLVDASDRALYQAKQNGRNRIEYATISPLTEPSPAG